MSVAPTGTSIMEDKLTLLVKAANQQHEDHIVDCQKSWTVGQLKDHLARTYPTAPIPSHQRLIFSGKLLSDSISLTDVFKSFPDTNIHTIHLVCSGSSPLTTPVESKPMSPLTETYIPTQTTQPTTNEQYTQAWNQYMQQYQTMYSPYMNPYSTTNAYVRPGHVTSQQYMAMRRMYANQYIMQYMQYYGYPHMPSSPTIQYPQAPPVMPVHAPIPPVIAPPIVPPIPQPNDPVAPQAANQNLVMNAQGGMEEEEEVARDWLDWIYVACRFSILLAIISFYSTAGRFTVVFFIFGLFYFYQNGYIELLYNWIFNRNPGDVPVIPPQQPQQPPQLPEQQPPTNTEPSNERLEQNEGLADSPQLASDETDSQPSQPVPTPTENQPGVLYIGWCLFSSFFTSLFPQRPVEVNVN